MSFRMSCRMDGKTDLGLVGHTPEWRDDTVRGVSGAALGIFHLEQALNDLCMTF